jgi:succinoglycan biosynthesis transport protein ExoP
MRSDFAMAPYDSPAAKAYPALASYGTQQERMDAKEVLKIIRRRRTVILMTILLLTGLSALLAYRLTPQYTATATVLVDPRATRLVNAEAVLEEQPQDKSTVETQIKLLGSRSFLRDVVERLGLTEDPEFNPTLRDDPGVAGFVRQHVPILERWLPDSWLVETGIAMPVPPAPEDAGAAPDGRLLELAVDRLASGMHVAQAGQAYVLSVEFTSPDPDKAANIANEIANSYVAQQLQTKQDAAARTAAWLSQRLEQLRVELLHSEDSIASYRADHQLIENNGTTLGAVQLGSLNTELIATQAELATKRARLQLLRKLREDDSGFESVSEVASSPVIANLRQQQIDLQRQEAQAAQEYGPRHPKIIQLEAEQQTIEFKIRNEIQNIVGAYERDVAAVQARERMLRQSLEEAKGAMAQNKQAEVQLGELEREAEANRTLYKAFLDRYKKLTEQQDALEPGVKVVSNAAPPSSPSFPRPPLIISVGFTGSLIIASLLAFVVESMESGLRSGRQVEKALNVSSLGLVPQVKRPKGKLKLHQYLIAKPRSDYAEAVRAVQIGLQYTNVERPPQIVLVTSSLPNEGKTTLALSLGASAAAAGHRTVVVDLDLRHPSVRRELNQPATAPGLVEFITGQASLEQVTHVDSAQPNLHIITVRRNPANPVDLLASQKMASLMAQLRSRYKYIILDAPPMLGISDTRVAVYLADATLFVVRWGKTKAEVAQNGMAALNECRAPVAGAVLTQVNLRRHAARAYGDAVQYYGKYKQYYMN